MRNFLIPSAFALAAALSVPANARPMTEVDLATLKRVAAPAASPDGRRVVYQLTETAPGSYKRSTGLWLVDRDAKDTAPVRVAEVARASGAIVVGITNRAKSPLVAHCDFALIASWPETPLTGGAFPSKISQLLIVDALLGYLANAMPQALDLINRTAGSVSDRSY